MAKEVTETGKETAVKDTVADQLNKKYAGTTLKLDGSEHTAKVVAVFRGSKVGLRVRLAWTIENKEVKKNYSVCSDCLKEGKLGAMKVLQRKKDQKFFGKCMQTPMSARHTVPLFHITAKPKAVTTAKADVKESPASVSNMSNEALKGQLATLLK